tara:strand:- start:890 stop:1870 length:981 start_codon:yes stop_codon:yes gene_type:complete
MIHKEDQILSLNKAELHIHLNGLFDTTMIKEVLDNENTEIPFNFDVAKDLNILHSKRSLIQYLKPWEVLRLMPKKEENLLKLIDNAFDKLKTDNIRFVELRSSVIYLSSLLNKPLEETLILFITLLNQVSSKYKIKYGLILTITRGDYSMSHLTTLMNAYKNIDTPKEIVGIDLAGNEDIQVSMDLGSAFRYYKDHFNLGITIHAGETGNIENIKTAIKEFGADRIGHGTAAGKCPETMELLVQKDICVEICPISNRRTGAIKAEEAHPVKEFIKNNVPFVICSDNPSIHMATLSDDYLDFYHETQNLEILNNMFEQQKKYTFIPS